jgi:hypothetical protein
LASSASRFTGNGRTLCAGLIIGSNSGNLKDDWESTSRLTGTTADQLADAAEDFGLSIETATWNTDAT